MGEVDKPFSCPQPGCGMSFTNEDHLTVHRRRHEMMHLTVPGDHHTSSLVKHSGFIIDQTPTPTRFLRQCEEVGLFQDLNPFDEQFRRASLSRSTTINESLEVGTGGSLDTPRILPLADSDETISSTSRDDLNLSVAPAAGNISNSHYYTTSHRNTTRTQTSIRISSPGCETDVEGGEGLRLNVSSAAEAANTTSVISTPTPVITAGPSVTHSLDVQLSGDKLSGNYQIPLHQSQSSTLCASPSNVPPSPSATVLQLLLRLPNGQAIPVEIPATPVSTKHNSVNNGGGNATTSAQISTAMTAIASNPISATGAPTSFLTSGDHQVPQQPSLAKMKLKAALASSQTAARPGPSRNSRANTADRIAEMTMNKHRDMNGMFSSDEEDIEEESCDSLSASSQSTVTMTNLITVDGQKIERRRRHSSADDDPAEKRRKFLERNRAAAIRCREKKKKWIETLACKSDELLYINNKLQNEVGTLRSEVAALKSMLLQHKDCPVTLAMQEGEYKNEADSVAHMQSVVNPAIIQANSYSNSALALGQKTRTRSLSMPSIPSSTSTPVAPLTLNPITYQNTNSTHYPSSSSTVSSTTKVVSISSNITPMNLSNSMSTMQQPILHTASVSHASPISIMKMSPARVASPKSSSAQHMVIAAPPGMSQLGEVTILGSGEFMSSDGQSRVMQDGTLASNIIVTTHSPSLQQISQQQHSNRILPAHSPASCITTQAANIMLSAHSPNNIQLSASKETHVPQLLNLSINNNKHPSAILRKKH